MKKVLLIIFAVIFLSGANVGYIWLKDNRLPNFTQKADFYVYPDTDCAALLDSIVANAGAKSSRSLQRVFKKKEVSQHLSAGHYIIDEKMTSVYVARMLNNAWQSPITLSLNGSMRRIGDLARKISFQMMLDSTTVDNTLRDKELLGQFGYEPHQVFSLFIPGNYEVYWTDSIEEILNRQKKANDAFWTKENLEKASKLGLSRQEVSTLASIIQAETRFIPETPKIAGTYLNRLYIGMPLQADPTVAFCYDYRLRRILKQHLSYDSPYNTYKHKGLPPGPICVPRKEYLEAVLNPDYGGAKGKGYLYFCASPDFTGSHLFAKTYSEHKKNAQAFWRALDQRKNKKS